MLPETNAVLVTGCSTGIGLEIALYLGSKGLRVYATVLPSEDPAMVLGPAEQRGVSLRALPLDITDRESIEAAVTTVLQECGSIYGLVNNAGVGLRGCFEDCTEEELRRVFEVNLFGTMAITRRVLPELRRTRRGRIVTITSVGAKIATFGLSGYCATKFALEGFAEALKLEVAPFGLHSVLIEPGIIYTPHWTTNRGTAARALDPASPYYAMFQRHEAIADRRATSSRITSLDVAKAVHLALTARRPRLRYVVGLPASIVISLRRHLPGELFERIYFGLILSRLIGRPGAAAHPTAGVSPR